METFIRSAALLVDPKTAEKWDVEYASGSNKQYPNLDLVRLEQWYFMGKPGALLEYAFGCGVNLLHLLRHGYTVNAIDVSIEAKRLVERKLLEHPELAPQVRLMLLERDATRLPYDDASFDYVTCVSVLSLLGSRERASHLLQEFSRVMKPGAKIIVDVNGPTGDFATKATSLGNDVYETHGHEGNNRTHRSYCPSADAFIALVREHFVIDDVGFSGHRLMGREIQESIICAHRA